MTTKAQRKGPQPYLLLRGRKVRLDQVVLVIPQGRDRQLRVKLDAKWVRYEVATHDEVVQSNYEHETLRPAVKGDLF